MIEAPKATRVRHLKLRFVDGGYLLERCEDEGCTVAQDGRTDCGRVACPACGDGGTVVAVTGWDSGLATCRCGETYALPR